MKSASIFYNNRESLKIADNIETEYSPERRTQLRMRGLIETNLLSSSVNSKSTIILPTRLGTGTQVLGTAQI